MEYVVMAGCTFPARPACKELNAILTDAGEALSEAARRNAIERAAGNSREAVWWFVAQA